jgi:hypothetical protein
MSLHIVATDHLYKNRFCSALAHLYYSIGSLQGMPTWHLKVLFKALEFFPTV